MSLSLFSSISWMLYVTYQYVHTEAITVDELKCSFESNLCRWQVVSPEWIRNRYSSTNPNTGPQEDGGQDGNFYIYVPTISANHSNEIARLESETVSGDSSSTTTCFRFWYFMFGAHVRNLTISSGNTVKFSKFGDQGKQWNCGIFNITGISGKLMFNVYRVDSSYPHSVIAIDHIEILHSSTCSQQSCETIEIVSTTTSTSVSSPSTTTVTTTLDIVTPPDGGVFELLPIVIGVPCGLLLIGAIVVGICISRRRHKNKKQILRGDTVTSAANPYTGSPRHSGEYVDNVDDEEVYHELDENAMVGQDNGGYIDAQPYDEIRDNGVTFSGRDSAGYINQAITIQQDDEDYLKPSGGTFPSGLRQSSDEHQGVGSIRNGQPRNSDYMDPDPDYIN